MTDNDLVREIVRKCAAIAYEVVAKRGDVMHARLVRYRLDRLSDKTLDEWRDLLRASSHTS